MFSVFVKSRDFSLIEEDYLAHMPLPKQNRDEKDYTPIISVPLRCAYFNDAQIQDIDGFDIAQGLGHELRAPEVLIGAPWDAKADVWNLGALVLEVYRNGVDFFGPFPQELLQKGDQELVKEYFDDVGRVKGAEPVDRPGLSWGFFTPGIDQKTRGDFINFMNKITTINPSERPFPRETLQLPCLGWTPAGRELEHALRNIPQVLGLPNILIQPLRRC
ncbi:serine/threonine protein kinase [Diaporthe helianthi]|uniref:Serine/threonine protein kinase n=1 Tax=Diaporthe helianthi TaxID=158607 RepID=A0A2P5ICF8_DIAHE|nr:serine/threonine protein kinase [Diaporthe helianthi]